MGNRGLSFLDEASERLGDPSISAGVSVHKPQRATGLRSASDKFAASGKFLEGSGRTQKLGEEKLPPGAGVPSAIEEAGGEAVDKKTGLPGVLTVTKGKYLSAADKKKKLVSGSGISESERNRLGVGGRGGGSFGLPSGRLPTIDELGGALGGIAKYVASLSRRNRARGLVPGAEITKTVDKGQTGMVKAKLSTLTKMYETAVLAGNEEEANARKAQIDAIIQGDDANAFDVGADIDEITNR
jgi:hypothetical protein